MCDHDVRIFSFDKYEIFYFSKDDCEDASDEQTEQCREYFVKFWIDKSWFFIFWIGTAPFSCPENQMVCPDTTIHQCVNITQVCDG